LKSHGRTREKIITVAIVSLVGVVVAPLFTVIAYGFSLVPLVKGIIVGFLITSVSAYFETFVFGERFKYLKFSYVVLFRTLFYVLLISLVVITVWVVHEGSVNDATIFQTLASDDFSYFMRKGDFRTVFFFALSASFLINFFTQINSLLGKGVLLNYVTGKYHYPLEEKRFFMFLDLKSSTTIAERLGPIEYHKFINNCFFDLNEPIIESKGEIYQYVGDEIVISWTERSGAENSNCVRCFLNISEKLKDVAERYMEEFNIVPEFKAGLHYGDVVAGEVGDSKREIVFHGDVLNTASRIQSMCNSLNKNFLVSEDIINKVALPEGSKKVSMGSFMLRGKEQQVELFSVEV
jgi:adenylate cyclase